MPRKKKPTRESRGDVHIGKRGRMLYLRWTYKGQHYERALGLPDSPVSRQGALAKAAEIERDIAKEQFDVTLEKYWAKPETEPEYLSTVDLWERYIQARRDAGTKGQTIASKYVPMRNNLERFGQDISTKGDAQAFVALLKARQKNLILKQSISALTRFGTWCINQSYWERNLFEDIHRVKGDVTKNPKRDPFTAAEVREFLTTIKKNRHYAHFHDFCATLLFLGLRPSEGIGLRWKDIDFQRNVVTISSSLGRDENGRSAGYARQRKEIKNGKGGEFVMPAPLRRILEDRFRPENQPDDLIFLSKRGNPIDDRTFSRRCWSKICQLIGVSKVPYSSRHTTGSHMLEAGASIAQVADALRINLDTAVRHYLHGVEKSPMPTYGMDDAETD